MSPILIAAPAIEPVSLAEAKLYLKVDGADEDDLIRTLIVAARLLIEAASRRLFITQGWRIVLDRWPVNGELRLPLAPVTAISAVRVLDAAGSATTAAVSALDLSAHADPPSLFVQGVVPQPGRARAGIEIDLLAGYGATAGTVPQPFRQAILMMVGRWFENRGDVASQGDARLPADVLALIAPFRRARL